MSDLGYRRAWAVVLDVIFDVIGPFAMISGLHRAIELRDVGLPLDLETVGVFALGMIWTFVGVPVNVVLIPALNGSSFGRDMTGVRLVALDGSRVGIRRVLRRLVLCPLACDRSRDESGRSRLDRVSASYVARSQP